MTEKPAGPQGSFHEHGILLYLDRDLYRAFIKLQADRNLGRSYAGLVALVTGFYRLGYISKEVYEERLKKYNEPLEASKPLTMAELKERQLLEQKDLQFKGMLAQWDMHPSKDWRQKAVAQAEKYRDKLPSARALFDKNKP